MAHQSLILAESKCSVFYTFNFVLMVVFAITFYRAGLIDGGLGLLWAALSVAISLLIWQWLGWGVLQMILGQIGLFIGISIYRVLRDA